MIRISEDQKLITLETLHSTYQMKIDQYGFLLHLYYGSKISGDASILIVPRDHGFSGNPYDAGNDRTYSLDHLPQEYSVYGGADYRSTALEMKNEDGSYGCDLRFHSLKMSEGKYALEGLPASYAANPAKDWINPHASSLCFSKEDNAESLCITLRDKVSGVEVDLLYGVFYEEDVITRAVRIRNNGSDPVRLEHVSSLNLDYSYGAYDLTIFHGRHAMERLPQKHALGHGIFSIGSSRGTSSHQYNPFVMLSTKNATEDAGECYGIHLMYSGNFHMTAEMDQFKQTRLTMGAGDSTFSWKLSAGETFTAPEVILSYSEAGFSTLTNRIHNFINKSVIRGGWKTKMRPVLLNNWEATYFDFNGDKLSSLADSARDLGMDLLVLDDGWFGKREGDTSGLGDWKVNTDKLGCSMGELAKAVNDRGLLFGLWFEPEAISEDSDLYRAHPDYALKIPGRDPVRSRFQLVLDFSRKEVVDCIWEQMKEILDNAHISYVKWDMNRSLSDLYSKALPADRQGEVSHRYVLGLYDLLERLNRTYPDLLIEGCSGGGGRFDAGMLYYTPQIWCSDNTDAINRLEIQYGTSFGYPISAVGSHVSAVPNHQTGRITPFHTRGVVASAGSFGYELDPALLSDEEKAQIREQIKSFKQDYALSHEGDYFRLASPMGQGLDCLPNALGYDDDLSAWEFVSKEQDRALVSFVMTDAKGNPLTRILRLKGLDQEAIYHIEELDADYPASLLMNAGIPLPFLGAYEGDTWHLQRI